MAPVPARPDCSAPGFSPPPQQENGQPVKTLAVGVASTPVMCLGQSAYSLDSRSVWASCSTRILSFTADYEVSKSFDTRPSITFQ